MKRKKPMFKVMGGAPAPLNHTPVQSPGKGAKKMTKNEENVLWIKDAANMLEEYMKYSESMRAYGRGFKPSVEFSPGSVIEALWNIVRELEGDDHEA